MERNIAKRKTASQREQEQRSALFQRISDIYLGARGGGFDPDGDCAAPEELGRIIPAVQEEFGEPVKRWWGYRASALENWTDPKMATSFLFDHGFRADEEFVDSEDES